ncbi:putative membrane protein [Propionispora sp. 2/2-37]|uniref:TonB family protein n=1 Tax=Propionispora sp. 2/2-37 TaxID=1677858 RepID=UPI0006BB9251|nr:TonB family protein [Propionispora sp. 2/2-37]CUH97225.1 putative membrane protein [Propionispora sp. 2/2-37]
MTLLVNSTYGKSSMLSIILHALLIAAFLAIPPAAPVERAKDLAEVEILPVPPEQQTQIPPAEPEAKTELPSQPEATQDQLQNQPANAPMVGETEPAPQAEALPGEAGQPGSVALRSGKGTGTPRMTGIPRVTGIPAVRGGNAGGGSAAASATVVYAPKPAYPPAAKKDGWEGSVVVKIRINTDGSVTVLSVLESERDDVKEAAVAAAAARQYSPERDENGIPVSSVRNIRVNFDLKDAV